MIIGGDRAQLDLLLANPTTVILLLRGTEHGSKAREVYDYITETRASNEKVYQPFEHQVLVTDDGNVDAAEKTAWFRDLSDCHAVLRNRAPGGPKEAVRRGLPISDLLFTDGNREPDYVQIRIALLSR